MNNFLQEVNLCTYSIWFCRKELATRLAKIEENINQVFDIIVEEPPVETNDDGCDEYGNCVAPVECGDYDYDCQAAAGLLDGWFDALYWDKS